MNKLNVKKLVTSALCLALCLVLPFLTGQIPDIGSALLPMHIPVLLCGFVCGWGWGLAVGFVAPLLRSAIFHMPPMYPTAVSMAFELAVYGLMCGLLYKLLPKKVPYIYVTLIVSMLAGRAVWGAVRTVLTLAFNVKFSWAIFMSGAFVDAVPGIILQIVLIPLLVIGLKRARLMLNE